jgi:CelD/BcsL family acetyltransferase involved in cellulose biosynthesis
MKPYSTHPAETTVLEDTKEFAALEEEWEDLYQDAPLATPFQSWAWLYSWWEFYGEGYELRLVTVRNEGVLVGIVPLMLKRRWGFGRLLFVGTGITDYLDMLARRGWEGYVSQAAREALWRMGYWHVAELHELRPAAAAWGVFDGWDGPRTRMHQTNCPVIDVKPWDELLMSLSKNHRSTTRRAIRRAEADGLRCEPAGPEDAQQAAERWMALHREAWRGREIAPEHLTARFRSHLEAAVRRMTSRGLGRISEFWRDGEVIASHFLLFGRDFVGEHLFGASQEALERYQISSLYIRDGLDVALERNSVHLDLLRGEEPYKLRWASRVVANHRVVLGRSRISWAPYASYVALRLGAKQYVTSDSTPQWIRDTVPKLRTVRFRARRYANQESASR